MSDNFEKIDAMRGRLVSTILNNPGWYGWEEFNDRLTCSLVTLYQGNNVDIDEFYNWMLEEHPHFLHNTLIGEYRDVFRKMESLQQHTKVKVGERYVGTLSTD